MPRASRASVVDTPETGVGDEVRLLVASEGPTVLLVEDSDADAELVADCFADPLARRAFALERANRLSAALARLSEAVVECVLLDLTLPDSRGLETLTTLLRESADVPVVVMTGLSDNAFGEAAVAFGAQDFLVKRELSTSMLLRSVRYAIERHRQQTAAQAAKARFQRAFDSAPTGMALMGFDGRFLEVNAVLTDMLDLQGPQMLSMRIWDVLHADDVEALDFGLRRLADGDLATVRTECRMVGLNDRKSWALLSAAADNSASGDGGSVIVHFADITARKEAEARLVHESLHDSLTGLPNRVLLQDRLEQALRRRDRRPESVAVWYVDYDRFKQVNDTFGHQRGDEVLVELSRRLTSVVRPADTVARLAGDEFVILADDLAGRDEATDIAGRIRAVVAKPIRLDDVELIPSVSIGVAFAADRHQRPEQLLRDADSAMYLAKERGKDRYEIFDDALLARATDRIDTEATIRRSIEQDHLMVVYQPVVGLSEDRVVGAEALLRIDDPERGLLLPDSFIAVAEETGLIVPMGQWILAKAIEQTAHWRGDDPRSFNIAVNLSARQVALPTLADELAGLLEAHAIGAEHVSLELTETVLLEAGRSTVRNLTALTELGISLGIDDFGTGYSSLTYLRRFPVDFVKIDRTFIAGLPDDRDDLAIVTAVIGLGQSLGLTTIAEGVETTAQRELLASLGCDRFQGYLFSRPRPADELSGMSANGAGRGRS